MNQALFKCYKSSIFFSVINKAFLKQLQSIMRLFIFWGPTQKLKQAKRLKSRSHKKDQMAD